MSNHDANLAGRISHFFTVNRPLSILLLIVSVVFGLVSFFLTPKQYNPEITRPAFAVTIMYGGATTEGAIDRVVYELVEKIDTVPGVDDIYTQVQDGSVINTTVIFTVGYDKTKAKLDLLTQLEQHSYLARGNINYPSVMEINPETIPIQQIVFGSSELSLPELRERVVELAHKLGVVEAVSELQVYGGYQSSLVVEPDPVLLSVNKISFDELANVLKGSQAQMVVTGLRQSPYITDVVYDGVIDSPEAIGDLTIYEGVKVRDVARVYEGVSGPRSYVFYQAADKRGEVVMLSVAKVEGSSAPVVGEAVRDALDNLLSDPKYQSLSYEVVSDDGVTAQNEIMGLTVNLIQSIVIVALVLLMFLSARAALVVLVAIPLTLLIVFGLGLLFDQTINRITLFALILSLGLLVDSAIVATENIYSHLKRWHEEPTGATRECVIATAIDEIGVGLLLSTLTSVIVFLPMNYITDMMGPYMGPIAFFVPAALIVSFLVSIVVTPFVASYLLHVESKQNVFTKLSSRGVDWLTTQYGKFLRGVLYSTKKQTLILIGALVAFILTLVLPLTALVHFQMLPQADRDQFYVYLDLPVGIDREETARVAAELSQIILKDADVRTVQEFVATPPILDFNGMFKEAQARSGSEQATLRVNLTTTSERDRSSTDIATAVRKEINDYSPTLGLAVRLMEEPPGPPVRATLVARVSANDPIQQKQATADLYQFIGGVTGVVDRYQSDQAPVGRVRYELDHVAATALGVSPEAVISAVRILGDTVEVSEFLGADGVEYSPITLSLPALYRSSPQVIDTLAVKNVSGEMIPLRSVLRLSYEERPSATYFEDATNLSYVTAEVEGRSIVYVTIDIIRALIKGEMVGYSVLDWSLWGLELNTPQGETVSLLWGGEWEMTLENFRDLGMAMGVALLMVYAVLVIQYNKFSTPAYILVTVPLGLIGILWGFLFLDHGFGIYLTATALIGFIALIGIVVNNAIILLEYVEQAQVAGASYREALIQAGEARLRPILLTSLTTVLGSLTIASDPVWSGLAWSIVFGLSLSTILTLIIYPTLLVRFSEEAKL